ncbi:hypothetical protein MRX96_020668 [Rhipicephalus microplus]
MLATDWRALTIGDPTYIPGGQDVVCLGTCFCIGPNLHIGSTPEGSCLCLLHQNRRWTLLADLGSRRQVRVPNVPGSLTERQTEHTDCSG